MSLGEHIYCLRKKHNLSQGDLADALDVSRQSISKWETGGAIPDLDKLVKLSDIFGVTLDELVTGKNPDESAPEPQVSVPEVPSVRNPFPPRKIAGTVLFCLAFFSFLICFLLGGPLEGLVLASPFLILGAVCFLVPRHAALYCFWALYLMGNFYLPYATGINWRMVRLTLIYQSNWNYVRLAMAWIQVLYMVFLLAATAWAYRKSPVELTGKRLAFFLCGWVLFAAGLLIPTSNYLAQAALDSVLLILLAVLFTASVRALYQRKHRP